MFPFRREAAVAQHPRMALPLVLSLSAAIFKQFPISSCKGTVGKQRDREELLPLGSVPWACGASRGRGHTRRFHYNTLIPWISLNNPVIRITHGTGKGPQGVLHLVLCHSGTATNASPSSGLFEPHN